jgi:hypothetical protein
MKLSIGQWVRIKFDHLPYNQSEPPYLDQGETVTIEPHTPGFTDPVFDGKRLFVKREDGQVHQTNLDAIEVLP